MTPGLTGSPGWVISLARKKKSPEVEVEFEDSSEVEAAMDILAREEPELKEIIEEAEEEAGKLTGFEEEYYELLDKGELWWTVIPSKPEERE